MFDGTFNGVSGVYACEGDDCSATNTNGKLTALAGPLDLHSRILWD